MNSRWPGRYIRLIAHAIRHLMTNDAEASRAKRRFLKRIHNAPDRGTRAESDVLATNCMINRSLRSRLG
jgi:hypothetical protein